MNGLMNLKDNVFIRKFGFVILLAFTIFLLVGVFISSRGDVSTEGEYSPPDGPALLSNSQDIYTSLSNNRQFVLLTEDLGVYARTTIEKYKSGELREIAFTVNSSVSKTGSVYGFSGFFEADKKNIQVTLEPLAYSRIRTTITGPNETNIDNFLPSNSQRNRYIATLPFENSNYIIDYYPTSDKFSISLYETDTETRDSAIKSLESGVGYLIQREEYYISIPTSANEGIEE